MAPADNDQEDDKPEKSSRKEPEFGEAPVEAEGEDQWHEASAHDSLPPLDDIPDLNAEELKSDTLEFERVSRRRPRKKGGLKWAILILVLGGGAYAAWDKWGDEVFGPKPDELPIVRAPETPMKVRPEQPGGIDIPNRDKLVYNRLEKKPPDANIENLLPRPEVPLPPPTPKSEDKAEVTPKPEPKPEPMPVANEAPGEKILPVAEQKSAPPTVAEVLGARKPAPVPVPEPVKKPKPDVSKPKLKVINVERPPAPKSTLSSAPTPVSKSVPTTAKATASGGYQIQLAAVRKQADAEREWRRLSKKHNKLLGALSLNVVRADLGKKGIFFRLRAGPLADHEAAKTLCQALAKQKVGCLVIRPKK